MIKRYLILFGFLLQLLPLESQTRIITDEDLIGAQLYNWSKDTLYFLDGLVVLEEGSILNIEAGTIIKGLNIPSNNEHTSALIIARGAQLNANGRADSPIIFTSEFDDITNPTDLSASNKGLWGGIIILGNASIGNEQLIELSIEGIDPPDVRYFFGGMNDDDNSGILRYVSIRHAGMELHEGEDDFLEGLTLGGVGRGTTIEYVEAYACAHDGFEFLGGTAQARYLSSAFNEDDAFDCDLAWKGKGQFWFGINSENAGDKGGEFDHYFPEEAENFEDPIISNVTWIGPGCEEGSETLNTSGVLFTNAAGGLFTNNIILGYNYAIEVEDLPEGIDSRQRLENGDLILRNNIWFNFCQGDEWNTGPNGIIKPSFGAEDPQAQFLVDALQANSNGLLDPGINCICRTPDNCLNPLLRPESLALNHGMPLNDSFFDPVSYLGAFNATDNWLEGWTALATNNYLSSCQRIEGKVLLDANQNCLLDEEQTGLANWKVEFLGAETTYFASTDTSGHFIGLPEAGDYIVHLVAPNDLWEVCENDYSITVLEDGTIAPDLLFLVRPVSFCPYLSVDLSTPFLRRCFENTYTLNYCNQGTEAASDVRIEIRLDTFISFIQASIPPGEQMDQLIVFEIGSLGPGQCGKVQFDVQLSCDAILGQTHCLEAHIFPDTLCSPSEAAPKIKIDGGCIGDSLLFELRNIGDQDMLAPEKFVVIEDDVIFFEDNFDLNIAESRVIRIEANGSTFRMQAPEFPGNPKTKLVSKTIEGCGTNDTGGISTGYVSQFPEADHSPFLSIDCQDNIGAFDPNDKQGFPLGVTPEHFIPSGTSLEYLLRFQNTGTDTAFNVSLVDTIGPEFDLSSLEVGAASHPYEWRLQDQSLIFNFYQIKLPDSSTNEAGSHGFIKYKIDIEEDTPDNTQLVNEAFIYFDFNQAVKTNQTLHTLRDNFLDFILDTEQIDDPKWKLKIYPNPSKEIATIEIEGHFPPISPSIRIFDSLGRLVRQGQFSNQLYLFERKSLTPGIYFFHIQTPNNIVLSGQLILL